MVIKYSRLISDAAVNRFNHLKWIKTKLPIAFLRQQVPLVVIVIASFLLLILTQLFTTDLEYDLTKGSSRDTQYGAIVDCGSSGTRAHIFKWQRQGHQIVDIKLVRDVQSGKPLSKHITPGLSSLRDEPDKASEYMEPIMNFISNSVPDDKHITTPIFFLATAGMRLLEDSIQKKILSDITRDLRVKYDFPRIKSQVITGEFEGIYSWLSLNVGKIYNITNNIFKTYGMIELGGASAQITFELNPEVENSILENLQGTDAISTFKSEQVTMSLGQNQNVKLFATTFLGLGVNSARESAIDLLARDYLNGTGQLGNSRELNLQKVEINLQDPCLPIGASESLLRPQDLMFSRNQTVGFVVKQQDKTFKVKVEGSGNFLNCITLLERVLEGVKAERLNCGPSTRASCPMSLLGSDFVPYRHYPFVGLSEMFFTTNEMMHSAGVFNRSKILHETNRICSTEYSKLIEIYSNSGISYQDRILYECFKASWMLTLLHNTGFKMPNNYDNFITAEQLDGREIDWTFGAMIYEIVLNNNGH